MQAGEVIIGNLDDNGYLEVSLEEILGPLGPEIEEAGPRTLEIIQGFDPPGVGARDLVECLLIQIRILELEGTVVETLIKDHLGDVARGDVDTIVRGMELPRSEVLEGMTLLRELEPKPGRPFGGTERPLLRRENPKSGQSLPLLVHRMKHALSPSRSVPNTIQAVPLQLDDPFEPTKNRAGCVYHKHVDHPPAFWRFGGTVSNPAPVVN